MDLSYRGNKNEKQSEYEERRLEKEMKGCTFRPDVNPLPQILPQMPSIRNNLTTIMRPTIDQLIRDEMKDEGEDGMINPKII